MFNYEFPTSSAKPHRVLMLQGPVGPFFRDIAAVLRKDGHKTYHICLTLPDYLMSGADDVRSYRGDKESYRQYLRDFLVAERIDRVMIMGSERFAHRVAIALGAELGIPVLSLEEGYIRPGFVTAEWGGNNRISPVCAMSDQELRDEPQPENVPRGSQSRITTLVLTSIFHFLFRSIGAVYYSRRLYHRFRPILPESFFWTRNIWRKFVGRQKNARMIDQVQRRFPKNFYVLPLQVADDQQLVASGRGWTNDSFSIAVLRSFAEHAPKDSALLVKIHPFERGHPSPRRKLLALAKKLGVTDRLFIVDDGNLGGLTKECRGMLTINSTSGFLALQHGVPLGVAGDAIFARESLCFAVPTAEKIDAFWQQAKPAEEDVARGFRWALLNRSLLPGNFYSYTDRMLATRAVATRLINEVPVEAVMAVDRPAKKLAMSG